jgi:hypothetical protein
MQQSDSVQSHIGVVHLAGPRKPAYTDAQISAAIKIFLKWRASGLRGFAQAAADELNELGFKPYRHEKWTPGALSSLYRHYSQIERFKNLKPAPTPASALEVALAANPPKAKREHGSRISHQGDSTLTKTAVAGDDDTPNPILNFTTSGEPNTSSGVQASLVMGKVGALVTTTRPTPAVMPPKQRAAVKFPVEAVPASSTESVALPAVSVDNSAEVIMTTRSGKLVIKTNDGRLWIAREFDPE